MEEGEEEAVKTPVLRRGDNDRFAQWFLDYGGVRIYCCTIPEAIKIRERIRWRDRTGMVPRFGGYDDCRCGLQREWRKL